MIDERQEELAALHAFDLLEGAEREQFAAEVAGNPELRQRVDELRQAAAGLALLAPAAEPPPALRARVLASAASRGAGAPPGLPAVIPFPRKATTTFPMLMPWLAAAGIAVAAIWMQRLYLAAEDENHAFREQTRVAERALVQARAQLQDTRARLVDSGRQIADLAAQLKTEGDLAHYKIATLASMLGNSPAAVAVAVWDPAREQGVLKVSKLPALAAEKDYQLWMIDAQYPSPVSAGVFVVDPGTGEAHFVFRADRPVSAKARFAVSLERKGGVPKPEGPIVLLSP